MALIGSGCVTEIMSRSLDWYVPEVVGHLAILKIRPSSVPKVKFISMKSKISNIQYVYSLQKSTKKIYLDTRQGLTLFCPDPTRVLRVERSMFWESSHYNIFYIFEFVVKTILYDERRPLNSEVRIFGSFTLKSLKVLPA